MQQLMPWQEDVIINSMVRKSSNEIALLLGLDASIVAYFISSRCGNIITKDQKISQKKALVDSKRPAKKKKPKQKITSAQITYAQPKRIEKKYANRSLDMAALIPVKIDHKTYIYIRPGINAEKAKAKFIKAVDASRDYKAGIVRKSVEVKKFKPEKIN